MTLPSLTLLEARILGVLVEKQHTVPDTYPLSLNALTSGCNQKTARDPLINATEAEVQEAIDHLRRLSLVIESSGGRVMRFAENVKRVLQIPTESVALLAMLMLRGPQTASELRMNCERLQKFSDISSVEGFLNELAERSAAPLAVLMPRRSGERESRWTHLLSGVPIIDSQTAFARGQEVHESSEVDRLRERVQRLEDDVAGLKTTLAALRQELGG